ncbi:MAG TPA: aspartate-semialdehyde dehydrogenase [Chloroflexota bacterium]|nr:aspartate-semialdehyde dehydrogenase [Chloroflexota bacterium]
MAGYRVAVVGATGLVGRTILKVLQERQLPVDDLVALASRRSAGTRLAFGGDEVEVRALEGFAFGGVDLAFFSAGATVSREHAPPAARGAALVVDNSSAFRMDPAVPLVVPEVNARLLAGYRGIVANPNCSTIQMAVTLQPLHQAFGLESVVVSTYQSVSGTGARGIRALEHELATGERDDASPYPHPIALNVLPHIDVLAADGWSGEERKMIGETRKIMNLPSLQVVPTTVRVPVRVGHSEAVYARFRERVDVAGAREVLERASGVVVVDQPEGALYPLAIHAEGQDEVFVGRIRQPDGDERGLALWIVADNLRKGAATNAVQIAECHIAAGREERRASYA